MPPVTLRRWAPISIGVPPLRARALRSALLRQPALSELPKAEGRPVAGRLSAIQIDQALVSEATKRGLRVPALPGIAARARQNFKLVGGGTRAFAANGLTPLVGADGVTPLTLAEWVWAATDNHLG